MVIVLAHWAEHLLQAFQIYVLGWPVPEARGALGYFFPWLVTSEMLHYGYALVMLVGLWLLRPGFTGVRRSELVDDGARRSSSSITSSTSCCRGRYLLGQNLFGRPVPTSIVQLWVPRVELHLFYNTIVFIPMMIAMYLPHVPAAGREQGSSSARARGTAGSAPRPDGARSVVACSLLRPRARRMRPRPIRRDAIHRRRGRSIPSPPAVGRGDRDARHASRSQRQQPVTARDAAARRTHVASGHGAGDRRRWPSAATASTRRRLQFTMAGDWVLLVTGDAAGRRDACSSNEAASRSAGVAARRRSAWTSCACPLVGRSCAGAMRAPALQLVLLLRGRRGRAARPVRPAARAAQSRDRAHVDPLARASWSSRSLVGRQSVLHRLPDDPGPRLGRRVCTPGVALAARLRGKWLGLVLLVAVLFAYELFDLWALPRATAWLVLGYFGAGARSSTSSSRARPSASTSARSASSTSSPRRVAARAAGARSRHLPLLPNVGLHQGAYTAPRSRPPRLQQRGCELGLFLPLKVGNLDCTFCLDCVHACPHDNIALITRMPGAELLEPRTPVRHRHVWRNGPISRRSRWCSRSRRC